MVRIANEKDRRATFVRLTRKGLRLFEAMAEAHERWVNEILALLQRRAEREPWSACSTPCGQETRAGERSR